MESEVRHAADLIVNTAVSGNSSYCIITTNEIMLQSPEYSLKTERRTDGTLFNPQEIGHQGLDKKKTC